MNLKDLRKKADETKRLRSMSRGIIVSGIPFTLKEIVQLIDKLVIATEALKGFASLPDGRYHGPDDIYDDLGAGAREALAKIEGKE